MPILVEIWYQTRSIWQCHVLFWCILLVLTLFIFQNNHFFYFERHLQISSNCSPFSQFLPDIWITCLFKYGLMTSTRYSAASRSLNNFLYISSVENIYLFILISKMQFLAVIRKHDTNCIKVYHACGKYIVTITYVLMKQVFYK